MKERDRDYIKELEKIQENFNMAIASITFRDIVSEARAIPVFTGTDTYSLSSFIKEVETLRAMVTDENGKAYISRILYSKIQGEAAISLRRLQDPSWEQIKGQLIKSFGVNESYLNLKEQADRINTRNVSELYSQLSSILDKLNLKYSLDERKPVDFQPFNNEESILEKFLNKINRVDAMYIRTKGIRSLEEAYQALVETGVTTFDKNSHKDLNKTQNKKHNFHNQRFQNFDSRNNGVNNFRTYQNNGHYQNSHQIRNPNNNRNNYQNNYRNHNQNNNTNYNRNSGNFRNNNSENFANRNYNNSQPRYPAGPEPMEVDHNSVERLENFHSAPQIPHYP